MILLFSLFFYEEFTNISWAEKMNHTEHPPGFILCYAPWCSHCKLSLPAFRQFSEKYKNDKRIMLGTIDCPSYRDLCDALQVDGYPTYLISYQNETSEIWLNHDIKSYEKNVQRLINLYENKYFIQDNTQLEKYPLYEFTFQKDDKRSFDCAVEAISSSDIYLEPSYSMKYGDNNSLVAKLSKNVEVTMDAEFTTNNIRKFLNEYQHAYFGKWSFRSIQRIKRRFILFATDYNGKDDQNVIQKYQSYFEKYSEQFVWGNSMSIKRKKFNEIFNLTKADYPVAIVIFPGRFPRYTKVINVNDQQEIEKVLYENSDNLELQRLNESAPFNNSFRTTMIIAGCFIIFIAILLIIAVCLYTKYSNDEQNNAKID